MPTQRSLKTDATSSNDAERIPSPLKRAAPGSATFPEPEPPGERWRAHFRDRVRVGGDFVEHTGDDAVTVDAAFIAFVHGGRHVKVPLANVRNIERL